MWTHIDLFSGIGGFALAAGEVWKDDYRTVLFCDNDRFCQGVLKKNFPGVPIVGDVRTLADPESDGLGWRKLDAQEAGRDLWKPEHGEIDAVGRIDLLTGGFPCQPFSQAGRRKGTQDDRHLWPFMFDIVRKFRPRWVVAENVRGILSIEGGMVFEGVCSDLEKENYEVRAFVVPACAVGAPHRRDRVWFVAHRNCERGGAQGDGNNSIGSPGDPRQEGQPLDRIDGQGGDAPDSEGGRDGCERGEMGQEGQPICDDRRHQDWDRDWKEVALVTCDGRMDDGLPRRVAGLSDRRLGEGRISFSRWRKESLKAYGNAIVPQVAMEIFQAIKKSEESK